MNVQQIQAARAAMDSQITALVQQFEASTGCIVHSLPVLPGEGKNLKSVTAKIQIP